MFGITFHDILTGMAGNAGWAVFLAAAAGIGFIYRRFSKPGLARFVVRGGISTFQLMISAFYFVAADVIHSEHGFPAGEEFIILFLGGFMYLGIYAVANRNWLVPLADKGLGWCSHISDLAKPEYQKPTVQAPVKAEDVIAALDMPPLSDESNIAILRVAAHGTKVTASLIEALDSPIERVRVNAAGVLAETKDELAIPALISRLSREEEFLALQSVSIALGCIGKPALVELAEVLKTGTPKAVTAAITSLGYMSNEEACELLTVYLSGWRAQKMTEGKILFGFSRQIMHGYEEFQHHKFQRLPAEDKAVERQKVWDEEKQWRRDVDEYFDFNSWYSTVSIGNALKQIATKSLREKKKP